MTMNFQLTVTEAARELKTSRTTIANLVLEGKLNKIKVEKEFRTDSGYRIVGDELFLALKNGDNGWHRNHF